MTNTANEALSGKILTRVRKIFSTAHWVLAFKLVGKRATFCAKANGFIRCANKGASMGC